MIEQLQALHPDGEASVMPSGASDWSMAEPLGPGSRPRRGTGTPPRRGRWTGSMRTTPGRPLSAGSRASPRCSPPPPPGVRFIVTAAPTRAFPTTCQPDTRCTHARRARCGNRRSPGTSDARPAGTAGPASGRSVLRRHDRVHCRVRGRPNWQQPVPTHRVPLYRLEPFLRGVSGRSLQTWPAASSDAMETRTYVLAHETLRMSAEAQLGSDLARYRGKVHEWIGSYARAGWPETTPAYAIRGYPTLLAVTADARLTALARDTRRHIFLLQATGSDHVALAEIKTAQTLIAADPGVLDLRSLAVLAAYRHVISVRNRLIPPDLPVAWARLDRLDHAEALARSISQAASGSGRLPGWSPPSWKPVISTALKPSPAPSPSFLRRRRRLPSWPPPSRGPATLTALKPSPAASPTPATKPGRSPGCFPLPRRPAVSITLVGWPPTPRLSPAPSPALTTRPRRSPGFSLPSRRPRPRPR